MTGTPPPSHGGIDWLNTLANFEKRPPKKYGSETFDTERYGRVLSFLGDPHLGEVRTVQILGTDGKGSTLSLIECLLLRQGKTTKSFISPHLIRLEERFRRNGMSVPTDELDQSLRRVREVAVDARGLTYFEALNAAFWVWVEWEKPDFVLLECGLGGRLDTTTVCNARLKTLTRLERDHFKILGPTMDRIANEKLAALRGGVHTLIAPQSPHLNDTIGLYLKEKSIPHEWVGDAVRAEVSARDPSGWIHRLRIGTGKAYEFQIPLLGDHQSENLSTAFLAVHRLLGKGPRFENFIRLEPRWQGRCQVIQREGATWVLDGSHTALAGQALRRTLDQLFQEDRPRTFYFASTRDRFPWCYLRGLVRPEDRLHLVDFPHERLWNPIELRDSLEDMGWTNFSTPTLEVAPHAAPFTDSNTEVVKVVCGSLYWTGEALRRLGMENPE